MAGAFKAPPIDEGDIVWWYDGGVVSTDPQIGCVLAIGQDSICVKIFDRWQRDRVFDGVRHVSDPRARTPELREAGGWESRPERKERLAKEAAVRKAELARRLELERQQEQEQELVAAK